MTESMSPTYSAEPWVQIVIVTFNSGAFTQNCLNALAGQTEGGFRAIIVDNKSTDGAVEKLVMPDSRFRLVYNSANTGFAGGSNFGLKDATTPYVMTLNPDTTLDTHCLSALRDATQKFPNAAMFSTVLWREKRDKPGPRIADGIGDSLSSFGIAWRNGHDTLVDAAMLPEYSEVFSPSGAAALYRQDAFNQANGFNEDFFCYLEDIDLGLRLRSRGGRCILASNAIAVHSGGHSTSAFPGFAIRQTSQNMLAVILISAPIPLVPIMLTQHIIAHHWFQFRNRRRHIAAFRQDGFERGLRRIGLSFRTRWKRPIYPPGATWRVMQRLSWSIQDINKRRVIFWPISEPKVRKKSLNNSR